MILIPADATLEAYLDAYKASFDMMRHYSNLRFTVLTAFVGISTVLFTLAIKSVATGSTDQRSGGSSPDLFPLKISMIAGVFIAVIFGFAEWRIGELFEFYSASAASLGKELKLAEEFYGRPSRAYIWRWSITGLFILIYGGSIALWCAVRCYANPRSRCCAIKRFFYFWNRD